MFRAVVPLILVAHLWYGAATWYGTPYIGRYTRSGELYTGRELTAAVSADLWEAMQGRIVTVCTEPSGDSDKPRVCVTVRINDSGDAEAFRRYGIAIDLSPVAFRALRDLDSPDDNDGIMEVQVWSSAPDVAQPRQ